VLWQYWFTDDSTKRATGAWWRRQLIGPFTWHGGAAALGSSGTYDARRHRELPHVSHRMLGAVNETADHRRRKLCPSDRPEVAKGGDVDRAKLAKRRVDTRA
jgi:hypothetical protein